MEQKGRATKKKYSGSVVVALKVEVAGDIALWRIPQG